VGGFAVAMSAVGACVGAAGEAEGAADGTGLDPSDFAWLQAATASGIPTTAASEASRRVPMRRERIPRPKRAEPAGTRGLDGP
jgi:hypothetical protein